MLQSLDPKLYSIYLQASLEPVSLSSFFRGRNIPKSQWTNLYSKSPVCDPRQIRETNSDSCMKVEGPRPMMFSSGALSEVDPNLMDPA